MIVALAGTVGAILGMVLGSQFSLLLAAAFVVGGMTNPLYSLLIAHTNDFLEHEDMAAASGGLVFINGLGAVAGPLITGWVMRDTVFGPPGFFLFMGALLLVMAGYAAYRMTQRAAVPVEDTGTLSPVTPILTPVGLGYAQEVAIEADLEESEIDASA